MGSHPFGPLGGLQEKLASSGPENQNRPAAAAHLPDFSPFDLRRTLQPKDKRVLCARVELRRNARFRL